MINLPTLRQLQYLTALHEVKSFGKAATICHVTQPTLSQAIIEMETILGAKVLDRSKRKVVAFTAFGLEVIQTTQNIMPELEAMMDSARQTQEPLSGVMRFGIIPTIAPYLLPSFLPNLQKQFPKMEFQIIEDMSHHLIENLEDGKIDIALMALPFDTKHFNTTSLFKEEFLCAAPKGVFKKDQKLNIADLDEQNLLLLQDGHCLRDHILSACHKTDMASNQPLKATSLQTLIQMVGQGYGLTLLPAMVAEQRNIPKNVVLHHFKNPKPTREIGLVWQGNSYKSANITALIKHLKKHL